MKRMLICSILSLLTPAAGLLEAATQVLLSDSENNRVSLYVVNGSVWSKKADLIWPGMYDGIEFLEPVGMALAGDDIYVSTRNAILRFNREGVFKGIPARRYRNYEGIADGLAVDTRGNLYFTAPWGSLVGRIYKVTEPAGANPQVIALVSEGLDKPRSLVIGHNGNLFVADRGNGSVKEFTLDGKFVQTLADNLRDVQALSWDAKTKGYLISHGPMGAQSIARLTVNGVLEPIFINQGGTGQTGFDNTLDVKRIEGRIFARNIEYKQIDLVEDIQSYSTALKDVGGGVMLVLP